MFFRNKKNNQPRRMRQPDFARGAGTKPVFSYHASSARTDNDSGRRKAVSLLWASNKPVSPRPKPQKPWFRRVPAVAAAIIAVALVISNLIVSREPELITLADTGNRQVFLREPEVYQQAASVLLASSITNSNKLTINTGRIAKAMQGQFPELEQVAVTLPIFGRTPAFYIQPARPALLIKTADSGLFIVDNSGRALISAAQVPKAEKLGLPLVDDRSGLKVTLGHSVLPSDDIDFITEVIGQLKAKNIKTTALVLPKATNQLDVQIEGAPYTVKFNLRGDARAEVGTFLAVKQHLDREGKTPGSYIDVRVDNKAYYR